MHCRNDKYLIKWKDYLESDMTWEFKKNLENYKDKLIKFHEINGLIIKDNWNWGWKIYGTYDHLI